MKSRGPSPLVGVLSALLVALPAGPAAAGPGEAASAEAVPVVSPVVAPVGPLGGVATISLGAGVGPVLSAPALPGAMRASALAAAPAAAPVAALAPAASALPGAVPAAGVGVLLAPAAAAAAAGGPPAAAPAASASPAPPEDGAVVRLAPAAKGARAGVVKIQALQSAAAGAEDERAAAGAAFGEGAAPSAAAAAVPANVTPIDSARRRASGLTKTPAPAALADDAGFDEETVHDVFLRVLNAQIEGAAADAHDVGWKKSKDEALANPNDPFVGWAPTRIRVTEELKAKSREELSRLVGAPVSEAKYRALQNARLGQDVTHPLFKPYVDMLQDQPDGGMRMAGQNALPLLVLTLYLSDIRRQETRSKSGFERVLRGLIDGTDRKGVAELSRMMHAAFQGAQLVYGERGYENAVKGGRIPARGDFKPFDDLHKDVQELDGYTLMPAARWLLAHGAGLPQQEPLHAFSELLTLGPEQLSNLPILTARARLLELRAAAALFSRRYGKTADLLKRINETASRRAAAATAAGNSAEAKRIKAEAQARKAKALWALVNAFGVDKLQPDQLTTVFLAFKSQGLFAEMVQLYDASVSLPFRRATTIREFLAVALHKTGDLKRSEAVIRRLGDARMSGEAYGILGKISKLRYMELADAGDRVSAQAALEQSIRDLEAGYQKDFEFYPGINLVYNMITEASERGDVAQLQQAERLAQLVHLSARKAGGLQSNDFWTLATMLESAIITGRDDEAAAALPRVAEKAEAEWEISAPIDNLLRLRGQMEALGDRLPGSQRMLARIDRAVQVLRERLLTLHEPMTAAPAAPAAAPSDAARKAEKLFKIGFRFGEIKSSDVGGNINFGGQLHTEVATRWDFAVAREILRYAGVDKPDADFARFNSAVDGLIRERFGTAALEDLHSDEHVAFDEFTQTMLDTMGVEKGQDSRTNIMVDFWLGKGDCRHHAYAKQLLFDIWKTDKINALMREAYGQLKAGDVAGFEKTMAGVHEWEGLHMLTLDSFVNAPIVTTEKYHPVLTADGSFVKTPDGSVTLVEDHTWNLLFRVNDAGELVSATSVDSFYQNVYPFGGGAGVPLSVDSIGLDGTITAGRTVAAMDAVTGARVEVPVTLTPTDYAGQDKRVKADLGDYGDRVLLRGIAIDDAEPRDGRPDIASYFDPDVKNAIERFADRMRRESRAAVVARLEAAVPGLEVVGETAPPIEHWKSEILSIMKQGGIPAENFNAVAALLEVGVDESRPGKQTAFRLLVKPGTAATDAYGAAAARVVALATPVIGMRAPSLVRWSALQDWIRRALAEVGRPHPSAREIQEVRSRLTIASSASGRRFFVRLASARAAAAH
jgi:hypothetical protein